MTWFYAPDNGALVHEDAPNPQYYDLELGTLAGQWRVVNVAGDATTAQAAAAANAQFGPGTKTGGKPAQTSNTSDVSVAGQAAANAAGVPGLTQIGTFFGDLAEGSTWIRVGEVLLGLVLIAIGVARLTHAVPPATTIARAAGAVALA